MEFWGVEVKNGEVLKVNPGAEKVLHLSQACLGELKKDKVDSVCLFVHIDGKKLVLGTLSSERFPQQLFDLVFEKEFQLSHNLKSGSVYFYGYKADNPFEEPVCFEITSDGEEFDSEEDDEEIPLHLANGKEDAPAKEKPTQEEKAKEKPTAEKAKSVKDSSAAKQKVKIVEPSKDSKAEEDDEDSDDSDDSMDDIDSDSDEDNDESSDDDDKDDDSDDSEEVTPKKVETDKKNKRPLESTSKTPVSAKKAKQTTPTKTDGKKGGVHVATPHPSKQAGKTPANKSNQKTPASSEGSHECKSCNRNFKSDGALQSHNQAKHSAK